jgi:hypothetical protein
VLSVVVTTLTFILSAAPAHGQVPTREYPPAEYYLGFRLIDQGDYVKGAQAFRSASRGGLRTVDGPWVDGVCYAAMTGECLFQMGDLRGALEQYTAAVRLFIAHQGWMLRVEYPATIDARNINSRSAIAWGTSTRRTTPGRFTSRYPILQGAFNQLGPRGILAQPEFFIINAHEVLRCTALAIRRRGEILGRTSTADPLNEQLLGALGARPAPPNHWSQAWIDCLLGMTYSVLGRGAEAATDLTKSLQIGGQFDHPLTPMSLLQLGRLAFDQGRYDVAAASCLEATISAAWFEQTDVMEEAFRLGTMAGIVARADGNATSFDAALAWARSERSTLLEGSLLTQQAHLAVELQQTAAAAGLVEQARRAMNRSEMSKGSAGMRLNYVAAVTAFQSNNLGAGETAWNSVIAFQTNPRRLASHRLFEIGLVDQMAVSGAVTPRVANELYADVLREPTARDWATNPVETMSVVMAPNVSAYEHWLSLVRERGSIDQTVEIADRIRRLRFFSTLPMGGRLLSLRWVLEATREALPERVLLVRQDLLARYPRYAEASRAANLIRDQLRELPLVAADADAGKAQQKLFAEWGALSQAQEVMLREMAVRREMAEFIAPPPLELKALQAGLSPRQAVLAFLLTSQNQLYGFLIRQNDIAHWRVDAANRFGKDLADLLRQLGNFDRNTSVDLATFATDDWKVAAADIWGKLTDQLTDESWSDIQELIIVPDRWLWYVPWEALPVGGIEEPPLIRRFAIRYVPTVSLALPDGRPANGQPELVMVANRTLPQSELDAASTMAGQLRPVLGKVTELTGPLPAASALFAALCRRVLVMDDVDPLPRGAYDTAPLSLDRDKPGSTLGSWFGLPWGAPDQIVFPNFHTMAEESLRRKPTGDELFLAACGLLTSGSRTVVLGRWRTGGQSSNELVREFVQETPYLPASAAWQRSVQLMMEKDLNLSREPRVKVGEAERSIPASHPFFWAGYLVIDRGAVPPVEAPRAAR